LFIKISHEAFTRAFKQVCGYTPSQFRSQSSWVEWAPPYDVQKQGETEMKVEIKKQDGIRLAVIEHRGNPALLGNSVNKLIAWANAQAVKVGLKPGESFAIAYDDPTSTPTAEFRMDLGIKVPANLALTGEVVEKYLPAGRYATTMHKGSRESIGNTVYALYRDWLPNSGEELGDFPCVFCYHNFDHEVAETEQLTECMLLCK
jgi:AraC family transcriptional regulator